MSGAAGQVVAGARIAGEGGAGIGVWAPVDGDPVLLGSARTATTEPVTAPDGTVLVGTADRGVVARGPNASAANGSLTCPVQPMLGFGRVYVASNAVRQALGCALEAEQTVQIHQSAPGPSEAAYSVEAFPNVWYDVHCDPLACASASGYYYVDDTAGATPFPKVQERVYAGVAQRFERGVMLYTTQPDGHHAIIVLGSTVHVTSRQWLSYPDP